MAWKQDLARLKQQLEPEPPAPAPRSLPKPQAKPAGSSRIEDEDAVFLSAMGLKPTQVAPLEPSRQAEPTEEVLPAQMTAPDTFAEAVKGLKGLKPMRKGLPDPLPPAAAAAIPAAPPTPAEPPSASLPLAAPAAPEPEPANPPPGPARFQLAAGMAIEVDGTLDLRGHSLSDAMDRLTDRLGDGLVLGWRSLLVTLGSDATLHQGLLDLLASGQAPMVTRYAQAPVPMGGHQAWLLYFAPSPQP